MSVNEYESDLEALSRYDLSELEFDAMYFDLYFADEDEDESEE